MIIQIDMVNGDSFNEHDGVVVIKNTFMQTPADTREPLPTPELNIGLHMPVPEKARNEIPASIANINVDDFIGKQP